MTTLFQKGFKLKAEVAPELAKSYHSALVGRIKELDYAVRAGDVTIELAREFGFCYGVDRAVEYAYEARAKFPDRTIFLCGEIIHNADVNRRLEKIGIRILRAAATPAERYAEIGPADVVLLPAFGVAVPELEYLQGKGCVLVDTTCGSVMTVWKNVHRYAREGFTAVIHGKHYHEETKATASQALTHDGGRFICVRDLEEAELVCASIRGELDEDVLEERLGPGMSPGFDPQRDLERIGLANQTTMLMSESLEVQSRLRDAMRERHGEAALAERFRAFDTICSATQDRQDAVIQLLEGGSLDVMLVIGGYNSSNTMALARICSERVPTYHIAGPECLDGPRLHHQALGSQQQSTAIDWLPKGPVCVGLTAGASTPDRLVGEGVERLLALRGASAEQLEAV